MGLAVVVVLAWVDMTVGTVVEADVVDELALVSVQRARSSASAMPAYMPWSQSASVSPVHGKISDTTNIDDVRVGCAASNNDVTDRCQGHAAIGGGHEILHPGFKSRHNDRVRGQEPMAGRRGTRAPGEAA